MYFHLQKHPHEVAGPGMHPPCHPCHPRGWFGEVSPPRSPYEQRWEPGTMVWGNECRGMSIKPDHPGISWPSMEIVYIGIVTSMGLEYKHNITNSLIMYNIYICMYTTIYNNICNIICNYNIYIYTSTVPSWNSYMDLLHVRPQCM